MKVVEKDATKEFKPVTSTIKKDLGKKNMNTLKKGMKIVDKDHKKDFPKKNGLNRRQFKKFVNHEMKRRFKDKTINMNAPKRAPRRA